MEDKIEWKNHRRHKNGEVDYEWYRMNNQKGVAARKRIANEKIDAIPPEALERDKNNELEGWVRRPVAVCKAGPVTVSRGTYADGRPKIRFLIWGPNQGKPVAIVQNTRKCKVILAAFSVRALPSRWYLLPCTGTDAITTKKDRHIFASNSVRLTLSRAGLTTDYLKFRWTEKGLAVKWTQPHWVMLRDGKLERTPDVIYPTGERSANLEAHAVEKAAKESVAAED